MIVLDDFCENIDSVWQKYKFLNLNKKNKFFVIFFLYLFVFDSFRDRKRIDTGVTVFRPLITLCDDCVNFYLYLSFFLSLHFVERKKNESKMEWWFGNHTCKVLTRNKEIKLNWVTSSIWNSGVLLVGFLKQSNLSLIAKHWNFSTAFMERKHLSFDFLNNSINQNNFKCLKAKFGAILWNLIEKN